jgi:DNA-binding transcriptional regulator YhcF (GntR family)
MTDFPDLHVDRESDVPLGTQLGWKLSTLIRTGRLAPETRLPGVRELAEQAGVHVNTVRGVYARLEEDGLIRSEHGRGTFVAPGAPRRAELARVLAEAAAEASSAGVDPRELAAALFVAGDLAREPDQTDDEPGDSDDDGEEGDDAPPPPRPEGERVRRRRLRGEIAELERDLVYLEPMGPGGAPPRVPAGRILTAAELEDIRDGLRDRVAELRADREDARRRALVPPEPEPAPAASPRVWRQGGVWTGGAPARVRTASFGA